MVCAGFAVDSKYPPSGMASPGTSSDGSAMGPAPYPQLCQVCEAPAQAQIPAVLLPPRLYLGTVLAVSGCTGQPSFGKAVSRARSPGSGNSGPSIRLGSVRCPGAAALGSPGPGISGPTASRHTIGRPDSLPGAVACTIPLSEPVISSGCQRWLDGDSFLYCTWHGSRYRATVSVVALKTIVRSAGGAARVPPGELNPT